MPSNELVTHLLNSISQAIITKQSDKRARQVMLIGGEIPNSIVLDVLKSLTKLKIHRWVGGLYGPWEAATNAAPAGLTQSTHTGDRVIDRGVRHLSNGGGCNNAYEVSDHDMQACPVISCP